MLNKKTVIIVHAIDTEGPLYESLAASFERLEELFGITHVKATRENLARLQKKEIDLGGQEEAVAEMLSSHRVNYKDTWDKVDEMLDRVMAAEFRNKLPDSHGNGWIYNWHCLDHVGFKTNPRRRDMGYHNIFDHYRAILKEKEEDRDGLHWHFHPMSVYQDAHRCATSYVNSPELYQILCRRIIERQWFPSVFRAGFQAERPDSHHFLEQWIPFDISNMALDDNSELDNTIDFRNGRSGDWRLAPSDWSIYKPSHDNYQLPGNCRRHIGRALNVLNRIASINQEEMDKAFLRARQGNPTLVGLASHDFRDLAPEVDFVRELIATSKQRYPDVEFKYAEAVEGFRNALWPEGFSDSSLELELRFKPATAEDVPSIEVNTKKGKVFGPQPFLAIETKSRRFIHDNFDFDPSLNRWHYAFHSDTLPLSDVANIGVAANDKYGNNCVLKMKFESNN
ncbi:hypothetical protein BVY02_00220 [bacterium J17]|nr:hypothetical protein BVY02_00220 [bacterium J17]